MQKRVVAAAVVAVILASAAVAGPFEDGLTAYERGDFGAAHRLVRPLAEKGDYPSQVMLGFMYEKGHGVPQDYAEAVKWYRRAAEQGAAVAQSKLGFSYALGQGVLQDYVLGHMWFALAAAQGNETALEGLNMVAGGMTPEQIAKAERLAREWKPQAER